MSVKILHVANKSANEYIWLPIFRQALEEIGELTVMENGQELGPQKAAEIIRDYDVVLTDWGSIGIPPALAENPGKLKYICNITGTVSPFVPLALIDAGITVTNWGDAPANSVAEGAIVLMFASLKTLHHHIQYVRDDDHSDEPGIFGGTLEDANVGVYGFGVIGRRFVEMLQPFGCTVRIFDPYVQDMPADCIRVESLEELFGNSDIIAVHAGLCDETRHTVTAQLLAMLPDHGVIVNTARGGIIDHDALFAELETGRLRAGLDVTEPEPLPKGHPARKWVNCIMTSHMVSSEWPPDPKRPPKLGKIHRICLDNLRRFADGEPLRFAMDRVRYLRST